MGTAVSRDALREGPKGPLVGGHRGLRQEATLLAVGFYLRLEYLRSTSFYIDEYTTELRRGPSAGRGRATCLRWPSCARQDRWFFLRNPPLMSAQRVLAGHGSHVQSSPY
jgi:hypothetical protein